MPKARARVKTTHRKKNGGVKGLADQMRKLKRGDHAVKIGLPAGSSPYPDGTSVIEVGAIHEFGSEEGTIPERSWLRSAFRENHDEYMRMIRKLEPKIRSGEITVADVLELVGTQAAADARARIVEISSPPNSAETIARKGSSNPLVDTGHLAQSVTHEVVIKK